ncbi:tRNA dihydrouridine synthase DusB [Caloranaerobacter azorensis]|uniref:tRNA-dihydrouridine synthase n=1 Tax=Caloranaerobacter azorensis TaxID=116090 RepID=A0A6P1YIK5_9FIRM|nr:tRNA dihydrouridine synthase DusB [Caloranaerobacter azorensis]QIB28075.1 tRNA dihydrouridine synthase DusB [Caloranaerobacter azorensis]
MKIGNIETKNNVFLAPMAGITDMAFRLICSELGAGLVYSEMISSKGLYYADKKTYELMKIDENERPIALQIFGHEPDIMAHVVLSVLNKRDDIDIIDINMGCPAPKIVKNGDGSALLKEPKIVRQIVRAVVKASNKPVTVKIRMGWDEKNINAVEIAKIIEEEGASLVIIHGRTREQFYSGKANWDIIRKVKNNVSIPVVGNGDIFTPEDAKKMIDYTGCDGVMIGRGSQGNPWIFKRIVALIENGEEIPPPTNREKIDMAIKHFELLIKLKGERIAVREMRKHIGWYIKGMPKAADMRRRINTIDNRDEIIDVLNKYLENL